ncbi:hypothetical protein J3Q64DRAFT_1830051 [Phycomyces blakesleeanus]|uniref:CHHC U11-48K-type domain-containing protein n=2 Tax=Phycomyces blakesleeanus TaxID=4837 RepID=A0A162UWS7_PHYB8|nr:hypothetical protein PHYBLDRAFT_163590 [Phycomyces blakesleeanus NRRL 1555(-)]OAD78483.1 hypothetical protein PHYBLDRAFT_163590 [Phycomyces blakesleeanus NRRL 1555(-)]|eukprot:XP_018296523.1 hypothetical protein PHYBLDRAFT_163590 [Phycomyces blakesleeanus NRRL 1555(-)]
MSREQRLKQLEDAKQRFLKKDESLDKILGSLGWNRENVKQWQETQAKLKTCPFNRRHRVPAASFKAHSRSCLLKSRGIRGISNEPEPPSSLFYYQKAPFVVSFVDKNTQFSDTAGNGYAVYPLPVSGSRPPTAFEALEPTPMSVQARDREYVECVLKAQEIRQRNQVKHLDLDRAGFEQVVEKAKQLQAQKEVQANEVSTSQFAENRDYRRRPKAYRVSLTQRTPTQIQKQLVEAYMQDFELWQKYKQESS